MTSELRSSAAEFEREENKSYKTQTHLSIMSKETNYSKTTVSTINHNDDFKDFLKEKNPHYQRSSLIIRS